MKRIAIVGISIECLERSPNLDHLLSVSASLDGFILLAFQ
jgi:hypothetical protein